MFELSKVKLKQITALPFAANFAAGAIAGVSEILTFYPLGESLISYFPKLIGS